MFAGTRDGYIEAASVFADMVLVVVAEVVEIGVGAFGGVEDNDTVEFEAFCLEGCGYEEAFGAMAQHTGAVAEVRLTDGVDLRQVAVQLLAEGARAFGSPQAFDSELTSLSSFFLKAI